MQLLMMDVVMTPLCLTDKLANGCVKKNLVVKNILGQALVCDRISNSGLILCSAKKLVLRRPVTSSSHQIPTTTYTVMWVALIVIL